MSIYIDLHLIQSVPPSNLNRDDTGAPKSAVYGGARRARVSSQAWKRATRARYQRDIDPAGLGYRTKQVAELIGDRMREQDPSMPDDVRASRAGAVLKALGMKLEPAKRKEADEAAGLYESSQYLAFFSSEQLDEFAALALKTDKPGRAEARKAGDSRHGMTVSLFGRMVADDTSLNVDASVQVAHALSTHAVDAEADYYTAVDDVLDMDKDREDSGAGMIGTIEFTSSTLYRYATLNLNQLMENLGDIDTTAEAAVAFVNGFVTSMPTGKQNTFANGTVPDAVVVTVRDDLPINLVGAFESPVVAADGGYVQPSCEALARYAADVAGAYGAASGPNFVVRIGDRTNAIDGMGERTTLAELGDKIGEVVRSSLDAATTEDS